MTSIFFILGSVCAALQLDPAALEEKFPQEMVEIPLIEQARHLLMSPGGAVPIEERSHTRINSDHFDLDVKGGGDCEYEGTFFLLPFYMGRYYGLIGE